MSLEIRKAIEWVKNDFSSNPRNFDASFDLSLKLDGDVARGTVFLPYGSGKRMKIAVIARSVPDGVEVDRVGFEDLINEIKTGTIVSYDRIFVEVANIKMIASLAKILGPKGLMPNTKNGSIITTEKDWDKINDVRASKIIEIKSNKGIINISVGRISYSLENLEQNIQAVLEYIRQTASKSKEIISSFFCTSTMGKSIRVENLV